MRVHHCEVIVETVHNLQQSCYLSLQLVDFQLLWNILSQEYSIEAIIMKSPLEKIDEKTDEISFNLTHCGGRSFCDRAILGCNPDAVVCPGQRSRWGDCRFKEL